MSRNKVDLVEQARQLRLRTEELERKVRMARGTRDIKPSNGHIVVKPAHGPYFVGDNGATEELLEAVRAMLKERPRLFREILDATGARDNRIKGVIMRLQREGERVVDVAPEGTGKALWFIPDAAVMKRIMAAKRATARR